MKVQSNKYTKRIVALNQFCTQIFSLIFVESDNFPFTLKNVTINTWIPSLMSEETFRL